MVFTISNYYSYSYDIINSDISLTIIVAELWQFTNQREITECFGPAMAVKTRGHDQIHPNTYSSYSHCIR